MDDLFRFQQARTHSPDVTAWFASDDPLRQMVAPWFAALKACGPGVCEVLHDGHPTACAGDAAFAYVDAFTGHASLGFFQGASLPDPAGLLQGTGKRMRHVKLVWGRPVDAAALQALIDAAYKDMCARL